jgi:hypothetical protein
VHVGVAAGGIEAVARGQVELLLVEDGSGHVIRFLGQFGGGKLALLHIL